DVSGNGQYLSVGGSLLRGERVADNWSMQGSAGAYWRVANAGEGGLTIGLNVTGMHYDKNLNFFTLGQGGDFSPDRYILGSVPISWHDRRNRVEYEIAASGGVQYLSEAQSPENPTLVTTTRQTVTQPIYAAQESIGPNYNVDFRLDYRVAPHW